MDTNAYLVFLVVGVILVLIDGQIIYHSGKRYLNRGDTEAGGSMINLVTMLFHLVVLGLVALISTIDFPNDNSPTSIIARIGVLLLVLALAHGVTIGVLARMREEQVAENITTRMNEPVGGRLTEPTVDPVPGQDGVRPRPSPSIEQQRQYTTGP
ncbi:MAG TPA: hypothetical protein VJT49_17940 [Amycolatopsis sp.]|uniref:hypothetical protein n=1 Tax=Amycolatopsis sp. TaxID=37632 RepID=UPI002B465EBF|nr:hypothetical protein [Amycolatopsis sp.]HKS46950.1 hypothetical protein [Amycolatopsis sp.]